MKLNTLMLTSDGPGSYALMTNDGAEVMAGNDPRMLEALGRAMGYGVEIDYDVMTDYHAAEVR